MIGRPFCATLLCAIALAGCMSVPREYFYTLTADAQPDRPASIAHMPDTRIALDPVTLAEAVDRPQLVLRNGPGQVRILEQRRWAEPLRGAIGRVVADDLSRLLGNAAVAAYPNALVAGANYRIVLDVTRFDNWIGEGVTIAATWTVRAAAGGATRSGRTLAQEAVRGPDYDALIVANSRALDTISRDIAQAVVALTQGG